MKVNDWSWYQNSSQAADDNTRAKCTQVIINECEGIGLTLLPLHNWLSDRA
jgi:hypothetical protein